MAHFHPLCDDQELLGVTVIGYPRAINYDNFKDIYAKHGLGKVDPNQWYPAQLIADVVNEIIDTSEKFEAMMDFVSIGMAMVNEMAAMLPPPGQVCFTEFMLQMDKTREAVTRGSDCGYVKIDLVSEKHLVTHTRVISPDDAVYGTYYAFARRYLPAGTRFFVCYDEIAPRHDDGAQDTVIHIHWD